MQLLKADAAIRYVCKELEKKGWRIVNTSEKSLGRQRLIIVEKTIVEYTGERKIRKYFWVKFSKDFFMDFNNRVPNDNYGVGESINIEYVLEAIKYEADFLFVYIDGKIYKKNALELFIKAKEKGLFREQDKKNLYTKSDYSGEKMEVQEETLSFPVRWLERWN